MKLFESVTLGAMSLTNRIAMAPMTRCRATPDHVPTPLMAAYYAQRATAGLLITEGVALSPDGTGYARIPGLYNQEQVAAWRAVTDAVHARGGNIVVQLMHTGRVSHPLNMPSGARVLAPSAVALTGTMWTDQQGMQPYPVPSAMSEADIAEVIEAFAASAALAIEAGFDGVEVHAANGYLVEQFLNAASNQRTDRWGGSVENRIRFPVAVARAVAERIGADRMGLRISPYGVFNDTRPDADTDAVFLRLAAELQDLGLAYLHVLDHSAMGAPAVSSSIKDGLRRAFRGTMLLAGGYERATAEEALQAGRGDVIVFGRPFIANPDLVRRLKEDLPLAQPVQETFYTPGEKGYLDYPPAS